MRLYYRKVGYHASSIIKSLFLICLRVAPNLALPLSCMQSPYYPELLQMSLVSRPLRRSNSLSGLPRLSPTLHKADVHEITSSKKGPQRHLSSVLGSHPALAAASFQQSIVQGPMAAIIPPGPGGPGLGPFGSLGPGGCRLVNGDVGERGEAIDAPTKPTITATRDNEALILPSRYTCCFVKVTIVIFRP